jgi:hypothetical protein
LNIPKRASRHKNEMKTYQKSKQQTGIYIEAAAPANTNEQREIAPPGNIGRRMPNSRPPAVMASIKEEKTRPVGRDGCTPCISSRRVGTHIKTTCRSYYILYHIMGEASPSGDIDTCIRWGGESLERK